MVMRARRNQGNGGKDASATEIASNVLRRLITAVTQTTTTAIANATVPIPVTPKTITYFSAINPYNNKSFETKTKKGRYRWHLTTKTFEGWKKDGSYATVKQAKKILDLFKDSSVQFGLDNIMNIPTSGTGAVHATSKTIVGIYQWNVDVRDYINILFLPPAVL